jgi:hypothetical protein
MGEEDGLMNILNFAKKPLILQPYGVTMESQALLCVHIICFTVDPLSLYQQPFTASFPHADIHELLSLDLLHQVIKGCFKDHLVTWVGEYLVWEHGEARAAAIMADIDRRLVCVFVHVQG